MNLSYSTGGWGLRERLSDEVGLALPDFASYRTAHSKAGFSRLLDQLGLPQPPTNITLALFGAIAIAWSYQHCGVQ